MMLLRGTMTDIPASQHPQGHGIMAFEPPLVIPVDFKDFGIQMAGGASGVGTVIFHFKDITGFNFVQHFRSVFN